MIDTEAIQTATFDVKNKEVGINKIALHGNPEWGYEILGYSPDEGPIELSHHQSAAEALTSFKLMRMALSLLYDH